MLKIALLGAPCTGKSALASGLNSAARACAWPVSITLEASTQTLPAALPGYALVLLTGLQAPPDSHCDPRQAATWQHMQLAADASIRSALADASAPYQVLYGRPEERLSQACAAIESLLQPPSFTDRPVTPAGQEDLERASPPWVWSCDKCSDPQCEHQLFTGLLARRGLAA